MKKSLFLILLTASVHFANAQYKIGDTVKDISFKTILNAPVKQTDISQLKGKVVWLEFWATWCSPCVTAMDRLQNMQKAYKGKLQVITITAEKDERIKRFLQNRPSNLWFAIDTANQFQGLFPFHTIPHSVLINQKGIIVAVTSPENITKQTIADVLAGKKIDLPVKNDIMVDNPWKMVFPTDSVIKSRFLVQPEVKGLGSSFLTYQRDSVYNKRRLSMLNLSLENAYRMAYGDVAYGRIQKLTSRAIEAEDKLYCIDIVVPKGREADLDNNLIKDLSSNFDLQATMEKQRKTVYVLSIADAAKVAQLKKTTAKEKDFSADHSDFNGQDVKLSDLAKYLEGFGVVKLPVVDETGDNNSYDINLKYMPEKKGDLENALADLGLQLKKEERDIDILVFR